MEKMAKNEQKYWLTCMFSNGVIARVTKNGLIYKFDAVDVTSLLSGLPEDSEGWYFNDTKDRFCAEKHKETVVVNPSKVLELLGMPVLYE